METLKKWLTANPIAAALGRRLVAVLLGAALGVLATVGLVPSEVVAACQRALGL